ncbi:hypothetical protein JMJ77_0002282 [Colletotrichum scovillei]|uniref:Uncharacterized protein n=1 Tax=Colletotrichum scovillei TaxID=1209932 RepID=A0A9P7UJF3_9PEZI|nr:hypothetical protein JMJ77_0002282 [Colletotrichum scovillei]KAG7070702.1 hypothetical protein JMJ76_0001948 [Colletotrichum scovillei]KAG7078973.1 hypothetical protein JMJ78_0002635 [Colletotrichum scovillei]
MQLPIKHLEHIRVPFGLGDWGNP